jgi:hypothetical protein
LKTSAESNPPPAGDQVQRWDEPFWDDRIDVISNPIFAIWDYPALQDMPAFSAAQIIAYGEGGINDYLLRVGDLYLAATEGRSYETEDGVITLSPSQCQALISLDPFYQGGAWQGVAPGPQRAAPLRSPGGGIGPGTAWTFDFKNTQTATNTPSTQSQTSSAVAYQSSFSLSNISASGGPLTVGGSATQQQTTTNTVTIQYQTQSAISVSFGTEVKGQIGDSDQLSSIEVYQDLIFGGIMFQDTNEPNTGRLIEIIARFPNGVAPGGHLVVVTKPVVPKTIPTSH